MIPDRSAADLNAAMDQFDREFRNAPEWANWQENKAHRYAIERNGQQYPVKMIVSLATGVPVSDFSGGKGAGQANEYVRGRGFEVAELHRRNPPWLRDELILALDLYLQHPGSPPGKHSQPILDLSRTLNRLGEHLRSDAGADYRNPNGVYMKLMNFRRFDPAYPDAKGLSHGSQIEEEVWNEFAGNPDKCHRAATAIRDALDAFDRGEAATVSYDPSEIAEAEEGQAVTRLHVSRERNRALVNQKKQSVLKATGRLLCEACGFDFQQAYGERGAGFIECHHEKPIHQMKPGEKTRLSDLRVLCSNCHRMIHARRPWLSVDQLRGIPSLQALRVRIGF